MDRDRRMDGLDAAFAMVFAVVLAWLALYEQRPPDVVRATAPANQFSAERAMRHVRAMAKQPHPMRSAEAAKVRDHLVSELRALGIEPELLKQTTIPGESLIGSIPGKIETRKALLLVAHYDSVPDGPGAGDDAAGVAAILETVRALKEGPPLDGDLMVLFTDGEEVGLCGARIFAETPSLVRRVGLVLNFEGRGNRGPSYMFETSNRNGWLVREFARSAPRPIASSLTHAIYKLMPNSTDLTLLKAQGLKGLNFAFVDGVEHYHGPTDTPENLDPRSVQHHGSYALALVRHFDKLDLDRAASEPDAVYLGVLGKFLLVYPGWCVLPLMVAAVTGYWGLARVGRRREQLTDRGLLVGIAIGLAAVLIPTFATWGVWTFLLQAGRPPGGPKGYRGSPELAALLSAGALVVALLVYLMTWKRARATELALGGLFWYLVGTVLTSLLLPGGSYVFLLPSISGLLALGVAVAWPGSILARVASTFGAIPALVILPTTIQSIGTALGPTLPFAAAPLAAILVLALVPILAKLMAAFGITKQSQP